VVSLLDEIDGRAVADLLGIQPASLRQRQCYSSAPIPCRVGRRVFFRLEDVATRLIRLRSVDEPDDADGDNAGIV
jgi:hypothetical protein